MNFGVIKKHDVANGPGVRVALFVSGCAHHCQGCFNPETWDFAYGEPFTPQVAAELLTALAPNYIKGLSLLGGEPLAPENQAAVLALVRQVKAAYPQKTIWCYSGYTWEEELTAGPVLAELLTYLDVLVDGEFHLAEKNINLRFRGSENQRIIAVPATLAQGQVVLWDESTD
ncbi:MAG: anaerobic ribonucleoside-triphosphate reductase activating protein [Acidaminococcaceae bacterium]